MANTTMTFSAQQDFEKLMEASYRKVYNLAYRLSGNRGDAEDLTQEAYFRAYRSFNTFEGDRPFENWILRIVTRLYLDLARSRKRRPQVFSYDNPLHTDSSDDTMMLQTMDERPNPEEHLLRNTLSGDLECAMQQLKPDQRLLVNLADVEQVPYEEIANVLSVPVGTVRSRLHRAHKKLRMVIEKSRAKRANPTGNTTKLCPSS